MVRSRSEALKVAMADRTNVPGMCQAVTNSWFGAPAVGDVDHDGHATAVDGWKSEPVSARHPGDRKPPAGVKLYFGGGSRGFGHACISRNTIGGARSTDTYQGTYRAGTVGNSTIDLLEQRMGVKYLGWSETASGIKIPTGTSSPTGWHPSTGPLPVDALDLSHWNLVTLTGVRRAAKAGVHHFWFKCTEGLDFPDERYADNRKIAQTAGEQSSAYHFARPRRSGGKAQAQYFLAHAKLRPGTDDRWMLDLEDSGGLGRKALTTWVGDFVAECERVLGKGSGLIYTHLDLNDTFGLELWVARYHNLNALPSIPAPWNRWGVRQFSNGVYGNPKTVPGFTKVDLDNIVGNADRMKMKPVKLPPPPPPPPPPTPAGAVDFRLHLVPGNKVQTVGGIEGDMALVLKTSGRSAVVFNTERESQEERNAVSTGLGPGWTRVLENENTQAFGPRWSTPVGARPHATLLAKQDPSMAGVSPRRFLDVNPLAHELLPDVIVDFDDLHLLSEANCIHVHVKARAWREKMWPIQLADALDEVEARWKNGDGRPAVLGGDFNTGVYYDGKKLFAELQRRFGSKVKHVHRGALDHIFAISTNQVTISEIGVETMTNNNSDHDMVTANLRIQKVK